MFTAKKRHSVEGGDDENANGKRRCIETSPSIQYGALENDDDGDATPNRNAPGRVVETGQENTGIWTKEEHKYFLSGLKMYEMDWEKVAAQVKTRTVVQTRSHGQAHFNKLAKTMDGKEDDLPVRAVDMEISPTPSGVRRIQPATGLGYESVAIITNKDTSKNKIQAIYPSPPKTFQTKETHSISSEGGDPSIEKDKDDDEDAIGVIDNNTQHLSQHATEEGDDGGDGSDSEESSLLSSWSDESTKEGEETMPSLQIGSEYKGIQRLEKKLALRKERLKLLCVGRPPAYVRLLKTNEEVAGEIRIAEYKERHSDEDNNVNDNDEILKEDKLLPSTCPLPTSSSSSSSSARPLSGEFGSSWLGMIQFEVLNTLPCFYTVFIICVGHTTFYGFMEVLSRIMYQSILKNLMSMKIFNIILIFLGLCLLRLNGTLFFYTSTTKSYNLAKMEMSNRLKVGTFDARLLKRIKGSASGSSFSMFGYYLICIGFSHFYYKNHEALMAQFESWFDGIDKHATEIFNNEIQQQRQQSANTFVVGHIASPTVELLCPSCEVVVEQISSPTVERLYNFWCSDLTYEYKSVELAFHGFWLVISIGLAIHIGQNMMTFCD